MYTSSTIYSAVHGVDGVTPRDASPIITATTTNTTSISNARPLNNSSSYHQHSHCQDNASASMQQTSHFQSMGQSTGYTAVNFTNSTAHHPMETDTDVTHESSFPSPTNPTGDDGNNTPSSMNRARSPRRGTKTHVASACYNCKRAHLACDVSRPCQRCRASGKTDGCYDVQHKKRGRPKLKDRKTTTTTRRSSEDVGRSTMTVTSPSMAAVAGTVALHSIPSLSATANTNNLHVKVSLPLNYPATVAPQPIAAMPSATFANASYVSNTVMATTTTASNRYCSNNGCCSPAPSNSPVSVNKDYELSPTSFNNATAYHHNGSGMSVDQSRPLFYAMSSAAPSPPRYHDLYDQEPSRQRRHGSLEEITKIHSMTQQYPHQQQQQRYHGQYPQLRSMPTSRDHSYDRQPYPVSPPYISGYGTPDALAPTQVVSNKLSSSSSASPPPLLPNISGNVDPSPHLYPVTSGVSPISPPLSANDYSALALRMTLRDFRIATASDAAIDLWMFSPMQLIGMPLGDLVHASDHNRLKHMQSSLMRTLAQVAGLPSVDSKSPMTESALSRLPADVSHPTFHQLAQCPTRNTPMALHPDTVGPCPPVAGWPLDAVIQDSLHVRVCGGAYRFFNVRMYIGGPGVDITQPDQWSRAFVVCDVRPFSLDASTTSGMATGVAATATANTTAMDTCPLPLQPQRSANNLMTARPPVVCQDFFSSRLPERHLPAPASWNFSGVVPPMTR
ncbi:hypothetical protein BDF19DRAFT_425604 [Syncephalis fuscata]|nr:hypothetical protein BDF19DRAFT_425604 [Syncephalis fuscata]